MKCKNKLIVVLLIIPCLQFWACQSNNEEHDIEHPAIVEDIEGTDLASVTLTEKAIERIGLQTSTVIVAHHSQVQLVVPYSSIIYDSNGQAWVYTSPGPRTFVRHKIDVDYIKGDSVFLKEGPPVGTIIATVGVAELYGAEFKIGH
jgi:hypothetical protein